MFEPWVGPDWGNKANSIGGVRLMLLGESHYANDQKFVGRCEPDFTHWAIVHLAPERQRFFTNLAQVVSNKSHWELDKPAFWNSVLFYNFVPVFLSGARVSPTPEQFASGAEPLSKVCSEHKPDVILACGKRLWGHLYSSLDSDKTHYQGIPISYITHPSARFSWRNERPAVDALLARVTTPRQV